MLLLPTGDGICVYLVNLIHSFDLDLQIALSVFQRLYWLNQDQRDPSRSFELRVGVNENWDNLIVGIKGKLIVAGLGDNMPQGGGGDVGLWCFEVVSWASGISAL